MKHELKSERKPYLRQTLWRRTAHEEVLEVNVPDLCPDVQRILSTDGAAMLRSKDAEQGKVTAAGVVETVVLYLCEDDRSVRKLEVNVPFTVVSEGVDVAPDALITAEVCVTNAETKVLNSRKLLIKAELTAEIACWSPAELCGSAAGDIEGLFAKEERETLLVPTSVAEKTFIFTDDLRLSRGTEPVGEILRARSTLACEEAKIVGRRAVVKGTADTEVVFSLRESGTVQVERFTTPFSQIVETDGETEPQKIEATLMTTGVFVTRGTPEESGAERLALEVHAVAQCTALSEIDVSWVSDVYSPRYNVEPSREELSFRCPVELTGFSELARASFPAEDPECVRLLTVRPASVTVSGEGDPVTATVCAEVVYEDRAGILWSVSRKLECRRAIDGRCEARNISVRAGEATSSISGGEIEVRVPVEFTVRRCRDVAASVIVEVEMDDEAPFAVERPSITVLRHGGGTLWDTAKRCGSSVALIEEWNGLSNGECAAGSILLVPSIK